MNEITETEVLHMVNDTNNLIRKEKTTLLSSLTTASIKTNELTNGVEFWKWMGRNYPANFGSSELIQHSASMSPEWTLKQLQGKGYEWDFMVRQRALSKNILSRFIAGDSPTQIGTDVDKVSILNKSVQETYQNKAYVGKGNPNLHNTPKDAIVTTNTEKTAYAKKQGYETKEFMNADKIKNQRDKRFKEAKGGGVSNSYNFKNVSATMTKAGALGCVIGITTESVASYKSWKNGAITDRQYMTEIMKAGGDAGVTSGITSGIMVPVSAAITVAGASAFITIPVAYVIGGVVNKVVAPCFARGDFKKILGEARYYQNLERVYADMVDSIESSSKQYEEYIFNMKNQHKENKALREESIDLSNQLKNLYDSI